MPYAAFTRQSGGGTVTSHSRERAKNVFAEPFPDAGTGRVQMLPSAGLTAWVSGLGGAVRAVHEHAGVIYAAAGGTLWQVTAAGVKTALGAIGDSPYTTITGDGVSVAAAVDTAYYVWDGASLTAPAGASFSDVGTVTAVGGYIVLGQRADGGGQIATSGLYDATSLGGLDFATAEAKPDGLRRAFADHRELWAFGTKTTEIWQNVGGSGFPFAPISGALFEKGLAWRNAVCAADEGVFFVSHERMVYRASAGGIQKVSTPRVDAVLAAADDGDDVRMFAVVDRGHQMVVVRRPDATAWVFDLQTGLWHERNTGIGEGAWVATCATIRDDGAQIIGGSDGALHTLGGLTDGGAVIEREMISLPISTGSRNGATMRSVHFEFQQGLTAFTEPQLMFQVSRNGQDWDPERQLQLGLGEIGEYGWITQAFGLGRARTFTLRLRITDEVDAPLIGVAYEVAR